MDGLWDKAAPPAVAYLLRRRARASLLCLCSRRSRPAVRAERSNRASKPCPHRGCLISPSRSLKPPIDGEDLRRRQRRDLSTTEHRPARTASNRRQLRAEPAVLKLVISGACRAGPCREHSLDSVDELHYACRSIELVGFQQANGKGVLSETTLVANPELIQHPEHGKVEHR